MNSATLTRIVGLSLVFPAAMGCLSAGVPTILCPFPALIVIPGFFLSRWPISIAALLVPVVFFFVWNLKLFRGDAKIPKRSYILLALATVLTVVWFKYGWNYGLQYQGARFTHLVCIVNVAWIAVLWVMFARAWKVGSSFKTNLFLHWMLFAWLAWYAFPYLGELP